MSPSPQKSPAHRNTVVAAVTAALLVAIFASMVVWLRSDLRDEIHLKIVERDAAILYPMALQQLADSDQGTRDLVASPLASLLNSVRQRGMLAVSIFDRDGNTIESVPANQLFVELPTDDFLKLEAGAPISRYHPSFPLDQYFAGISPDQRRAPVLEVLLPLPSAGSPQLRGFVRYYIDARPLSEELATIDGQIDRQTLVTLGLGAILIIVVVTAATINVQRAQRTIAERNERLTRANFDLTLSAKASAVGQITSHLIHGLQGSVEGLRAVVAKGDPDPEGMAWKSAAGYTERLQTMIRETIALLSDASAGASYELSGAELAGTIRAANAATACERGVSLDVGEGFVAKIDSHRGSLLCLIASNLIQNAIAATEPGRKVVVALADAGWAVVLTVTDEGAGIPEAVQKHLFRPGRSGRPGGSGLGLAISQLMARQMDAELVLLSTGSEGTTFRLTIPCGD